MDVLASAPIFSPAHWKARSNFLVIFMIAVVASPLLQVRDVSKLSNVEDELFICRSTLSAGVCGVWSCFKRLDRCR